MKEGTKDLKLSALRTRKLQPQLLSGFRFVMWVDPGFQVAGEGRGQSGGKHDKFSLFFFELLYFNTGFVHCRGKGGD